MQTHFEYIVEQISARNILHGKKLQKNIGNLDAAFFSRAEIFFNKYLRLLELQGQTIDYSIDCYLQMLADVNYESVQFIQTGEYSSKSFAEVNERVYSKPEVMEYYMHGLLLSQFLWPQHYNILLFFNKIILKNGRNIAHYLEVGGGHGLYISEAIAAMGHTSQYELVDISQSSIAIARAMINHEAVSYIHSDIFNFQPGSTYDFITMGEVLEHVEDPLMLLKKLHSLLNPEGKLFITTPTNAPAIDHIYLFNNAEEIRVLIKSAGFEIESESCIYSEDVSAEVAEKYKVSMMYAAVLIKQTS
jgi:2-polyprenyl-3-methyl-5-hydroxy-6-metoxy-1,4-benzoquinol methylase